MLNKDSDQEIRDVEVWEFGITESEIDRLIEKLNVLKQSKTRVSFDLDEEHEFLINYISEGKEEKNSEDDQEPMGIRG